MSFKISGKLPSGKLKERIQLSPNYKDGAFQNLSITPMKQEGVTYWKMTKEFLKKHPDTAPPAKLPFVKTDLNKLNRDEPVIVWFGHSSYFIRIDNKNFLIDPVFSGNAAPVSFMVKAFPGSNEYKAGAMPAILFRSPMFLGKLMLSAAAISAISSRENSNESAPFTWWFANTLAMIAEYRFSTTGAGDFFALADSGESFLIRVGLLMVQ